MARSGSRGSNPPTMLPKVSSASALSAQKQGGRQADGPAGLQIRGDSNPCGTESGVDCRAPEGTINQMLSISPRLAAPVMARARGEVSLAVRSREGGVSLTGLRQSGSLKCLFPRTAGRALQAVLLNSAGGVTGGDRLSLSARAEANAALTLTTQAAERIYRALPGETGRIETRLDVAAGARVDWLPQETILFDGCALERSLRVDMQEGAALLLAEPLVFGRLEAGETVTSARFLDRVEVRRAGVPVCLDSIRLEGDVQAQLDRPGVAGGARAMASLVYVAPDAEARLATVRRLLPRDAGASLLDEDVMVMRILALDGNGMRSRIVPILDRLSHDGLPRCWSI